jgi:hypothetical protein
MKKRGIRRSPSITTQRDERTQADHEKDGIKFGTLKAKFLSESKRK